jgi:hypothetical protein
MWQQKLTGFLRECYWLVEQVLEAPYEMERIKEQLNRKVDEPERREAGPKGSLTAGEDKKVA